MKEQLLKYARYNQWANTQLVGLFRQTPDALVEQTVVSSFPSIFKTLLHLWDVEVLWLQRLEGHSPKDFPSKHFNGTTTDVYDGLLAASERLVQFVENQDETFLQSPLEFTLLTAPGTRSELAGDMVQHLINHQTSHRGQLITMCRQLGITDIPRTDYIIWVRSESERV